MPLLIDGHNLIGANVFRDIRLSDEDDEAKLVARLKVWKSRYPGTMTVIFDRGITGGPDVKLGGAGVEVVFAASPAEADDLIRRRLRKATPGLILVSNDAALIGAAAAHHVTTWRGAEFVKRLTAPRLRLAEPGTEHDIRQSADEIAEWLAIFNARLAKRQKAKQAKRSKQGKLTPSPKPGKAGKPSKAGKSDKTGKPRRRP